MAKLGPDNNFTAYIYIYIYPGGSDLRPHFWDSQSPICAPIEGPICALMSFIIITDSEWAHHRGTFALHQPQHWVSSKAMGHSSAYSHSIISNWLDDPAWRDDPAWLDAYSHSITSNWLDDPAWLDIQPDLISSLTWWSSLTSWYPWWSGLTSWYPASLDDPAWLGDPAPKLVDWLSDPAPSVLMADALQAWWALPCQTLQDVAVSSPSWIYTPPRHWYLSSWLRSAQAQAACRTKRTPSLLSGKPGKPNIP